jgi:glutamate/tyrosine decarboxylase-like PLP-dependent enzyme
MLLFSRRQAPKLEGIGAADTVTMDPHKILGLNQSLGALIVRERRTLHALGKVGLRYYVHSDAPDLGDFTLDGSRALNSLGAWILLRAFGRSGYERMVDHFFSLTAEFTRRLCASGRFELFPEEPEMNVVAFRLRPGTTDVAVENHRNDALLERLLSGRRFAASCYRHPSGPHYLRAVFVNPASRLSHAAAFADELIRLAASADSAPRS